MNRQWTYELYDDGETFAVYDDGNMIAHCLSPEDARIIVVNHDEVIRLRARIADLEAELNSCVKVLEQVDFTSGCNGQKCVSGHIKTLIDLLAAMEAAQQWHPASEPPEAWNMERHHYSRLVEVQFNDGLVGTSDFYHYADTDGKHCGSWTKPGVIRWRNLPPMQERSET